MLSSLKFTRQSERSVVCCRSGNPARQNHMKSNITTEYPIGARQDIDFNARSFPMPNGFFLDRRTELAWACAAIKHGIDAHDVFNQLRYWRSTETKRLLQIRRRGQEAPGDSLGVRFVDRFTSRPLSPATFRYDRAVGVEIECFGPEVGPRLPLWMREGSDGSLQPTGEHPGREYRLLVKRSELEVRLHKACALLAAHSVNKSCGLHVHLDMRGKSLPEVTKLARHLDKWLKALREYVPASRRENTFCRFGISTTDRYHAVNLTSFRKYQTLEIRLHSGTVSFEKILAWVRLLELLTAVRSGPKGEGVAAMASLPMCEYERGYWAKRHIQLNPSQYTAGLPSNESE
jgi:hypothetical protein